MNLKTMSLLNKMFEMQERSIDWLISSWEMNLNPYERKIRKLRFYQYREKEKELADELNLLIK